VLLAEAYQETKLLAAAEIKQAVQDRKLLRDIEGWRTGNVKLPGFPGLAAQSRGGDDGAVVPAGDDCGLSVPCSSDPQAVVSTDS
jgi:hypothetical protein